MLCYILECHVLMTPTHIPAFLDLCMSFYIHKFVYMYVYALIHMSHRGGLWQYFYSVRALGIIHQQQSWFGAIC